MPDVFLQINRVVGAISPMVSSGIEIRASVSRVIGSVSVVLERETTEVSVSISRVVGQIAPFVAGIEPAVSVTIPRVVGAIRPFVKTEGSIWNGPPGYVPPPGPGGKKITASYLPLIEMNSYAWSNDPGLVATQMSSGVRRQRRRDLSKVRLIEVTLRLSCVQLANLEEVLAIAGADWFLFPVMSGQSEGNVVDHQARITDVVSISAIGEDLYEVQMRMEILFVP